jgi:hypothetical protein
LVAEADSVVIVLTKAHLSSHMCNWELEEALKHAKRIVPVQAEPLDGVSVPARMAAINYVRFDYDKDQPPCLFIENLASLRKVLVTDLSWVREHTNLLAKAAEWEAAGHVAHRMLVGEMSRLRRGGSKASRNRSLSPPSFSEITLRPASRQRARDSPPLSHVLRALPEPIGMITGRISDGVHRFDAGFLPR